MEDRGLVWYSWKRWRRWVIWGMSLLGLRQSRVWPGGYRICVATCRFTTVTRGQRRGRTLFLSIDIDLDVGLFERSPFEVFLVTAAFNVPSGALLTAGLFLTALQTFGFACYATCPRFKSVHVHRVLYSIINKMALEYAKGGVVMA